MGTGTLFCLLKTDKHHRLRQEKNGLTTQIKKTKNCTPGSVIVNLN
jgi:hypothetical protein